MVEEGEVYDGRGGGGGGGGAERGKGTITIIKET